MVDSHTHLSSCEQPDDELVAAALEAGMTRIVTIGTDVENSALALAAAERFPEVYATVGLHPNEATGFSDGDYAGLHRLAQHPRCVAIGETGLDYYREYAPHEEQARAFRAQIEIAREVGKPLSIHTRDADDDTLAMLDERARGVKVILHCFSMAERVDDCLAHPDWYFSFAGNVTYPKNADLRAAMLKVPAARLLVETDAPYLSPQPLRGKRNVPANVVLTAQAIAVERRVSYHDFNLEVEATAAKVFGWARSTLVKLGQNFLVDRNILDVIERLATLSDDDVVLEVGGGPGVLSQRLAERAAFVHVVELDRSLESNLRGLLDPHPNVTLHMGDALDLDLGAFEPAPTKMVANLPYGVAATVILRTIGELPSIQSWVVMVQREVGERFAAKPGSSAYGVPSVLAQLECDVKVLRPVSRQVFRPVPNVDSVLLGLSRRAGQRASTTEIRLVHDAFRHRRKALAGSLQLSQPGMREPAREALVDMGLPADVRAERLAPAQFVELARKLYP